MSNLEGARHKAEATERDLAEARKVAAAWHDKVGGEHAFLVCLFVTVVCVLGVGGWGGVLVWRRPGTTRWGMGKPIGAGGWLLLTVRGAGCAAWYFKVDWTGWWA